MKKMRDILLKNQWLHYMSRCIHNYNNDLFVRRMFEINTNSNIVDFSHYGEQNEGKAVYYIYFEDTGNGFFAEFRKLLNALYFADTFGMQPVVEYSTQFSYAEENGVDGIQNPFEYYYKQPAAISLGQMRKSKMVVNFRPENLGLAERLKPENGYLISDEYEKVMADMIAKYISYNTKVEEQLNKDIKELLGDEKVLGVHVRGTDFKNQYNRHPSFVSIYEYLECAKIAFEQEKFEKVYLATDDAEAVTIFRGEFGDNLLLFSDVIRSDGNVSVMLSSDERPLHRYRLGYEVIRDMHTLSCCDGLVAGLSQVSICSRLVKKSRGEEYSFMKVLDKGINKNNNRFSKDFQKIKASR